MLSIQKKLLLYIIILGMIPLIFTTYYYYDMTRTKMMDELNSESDAILEQIDSSLAVKTSRLQNTMDILIDNEQMHRTLYDFAFPENGNLTQTYKKMEDVFTSFCRSERELKNIIWISVNGEIYVSGEPLEVKDPRRFIFRYDNVGTSGGVLSWLGKKERSYSEENETLIAATMLRDTRYMKNQTYLATMYLVFNEALFDSIGNRIPDTSKECISVYDENSKLIYSIGNKRLSNILLEVPLNSGIILTDGNKRNFRMKIEDTEYMVFYNTSSITNWRLVRTIPYNQYHEGLVKVLFLTLLCFVLLFVTWYTLSYFVIKRITTPIRELVGAMKKVTEENFEVELKVRTKDEFGIINAGFNDMVRNIKELFEKTIIDEEKRRSQEILMLRYQMNPHFLYNTLGAIRLTAIMNKQDKIAKMLLILGRFLRNAILTANNLLDVKTEISNINDYISLYQLRCDDKLVVSIDVQEVCFMYLIPSMMCQPIIENAVMHGLNDKFDSGESAEINVKIYEEDDALWITVYDNGNGIDEKTLEKLFDDTQKPGYDDRLHIGLKNIHKRIKLIYGEEYGVFVESKKGD